MKKTMIDLVAAARPNFMKIAPLFHALKDETWCSTRIVHTGQHYDAEMSVAFLEDLGLPEPDIQLGIGSGSHAEQTGGVMVAYERVCMRNPPDLTVVVGDVNSTMACALAAKKLCILVAHLEAGLRSGDRTMPEELNRVVTDALADILWTPSPDADENLLREGVAEERIERVGNIMIDSYELMREEIEADPTRAELGFESKTFGVVTLHRPSNVDIKEALQGIVDALIETSEQLPLIFPVHPRTMERLRSFGLFSPLEAAPNICISRPLSYVAFMGLVCHSKLVITDSGGIQEETTYLDIPCLTLRTTTERPITITQGTNRLVEREELGPAAAKVLSGIWKHGVKPDLWDGQTATRIVVSIRSRFDKTRLLKKPGLAD